jgi:hypothetical protein
MDEDLLKRYQKVFSQNEGGLRNEGALRQRSVLETDEQDWPPLLRFLHASPYSVAFLVDGEHSPLPEQVDDLFALSEDDQGHVIRGLALCIDREHLEVWCDPFREGVEYFFPASTFADEATIGEQVARLLDFIRTISQVLHKVIILTPESAADFPLFRYDPSTKDEEWFLEHIEAME